MGATMTGIIEYTDNAQGYARPDLNIALEEPRWNDDSLHGILFNTDKEYDFFAAISGARSRFAKSPLVPVRGVPPNLSIPADDCFARWGRGDAFAGWLLLSEIDACIRHVSDEPIVTDLELVVALDLMRRLVAKLTDPHVRLVFNIGGA